MAGKRIPIEHRKWLAGPELRRLGIKCTDTILRQRRRIEMREWKESYVRAYSNPRRRGTYLYLVEDVKLLYKYADKSHDEPFVEDGKRWCPLPWLASDEAEAEDLYFEKHLPLQWERRGCPWRDGEKHHSRLLLVRVGDGLLGWVKFFDAEILREIKDAQKNPPNQDLAGNAEARREFKLCDSVIERSAARINPRLKDRRMLRKEAYIQVKIKVGKNAGNVYLRKRAGSPLADLKTLGEKGKVEPPEPKLWVTIDRAAEEAEISRRRLGTMIQDGYEDKDGKKHTLGPKKKFTIEVVGSPKAGMRLMEVFHISRPKFDEFLKFREGRETRKTPYTDSDGTWLRHGFIRATYGWNRTAMARFRSKWISQHAADGAPRPFKRIPKPIGADGQEKEWGYLQSVMVAAAAAVDAGRHRSPAAALAANLELGVLRSTSAPEEAVLTRILKAAERRPSEQPSKQPNKPGRKSLRDETASRRTEALSAWDRAKTAGTSVKDFCNDWNAEHRDNLLSAETIKKYQSWRAMQRSRSRG